MKPEIKVVINPAAGNAAVLKKWPRVETALKNILGPCDCEFTHHPLHATQITREALRRGYDTIVAVGGDGTIHEAANGFFSNGKPIRPDAALGIVAMGTAGDLLKSLQVPRQLQEALQRIKSRHTKRLDLGELQYTTMDGKNGFCYFINIADAGFGGQVVEAANQTRKHLGPFTAYLSALLKTLFRFENKPVRITVDDRQLGDFVVNAIVVANGQFFGGGMWIAPTARMDDGLFEVTIVGNVTRTEVLANLRKLYKGRIAEHAKVKTLQGKRIFVESEAEVKIDADGELVGKLPARFTIRPGAIHVVV